MWQFRPILGLVFVPLVPFSSPRKQKTKDFLIFRGYRKRFSLRTFLRSDRIVLFLAADSFNIGTLRVTSTFNLSKFQSPLLAYLFHQSCTCKPPHPFYWKRQGLIPPLIFSLSILFRYQFRQFPQFWRIFSPFTSSLVSFGSKITMIPVLLVSWPEFLWSVFVMWTCCDILCESFLSISDGEAFTGKPVWNSQAIVSVLLLRVLLLMHWSNFGSNLAKGIFRVGNSTCDTYRSNCLRIIVISCSRILGGYWHNQKLHICGNHTHVVLKMVI